MTVSTVVDHNDYTGNGVTTSFPYTFRIFKKTDLTVSVVDLNENITELIVDTDYTVTNAGGYSGGNVVLTTPLATGWQISIARELEATQETDLRNQGKFFAEVHEDAFDKLTMLIQQGFSIFRLALRKPSSVANWYDALGNYIRNVKDPRDAQDAATKGYVDTLANGNLSRTLRVPEPINPLPGAADRAGKIPAFNSAGDAIVILPPSGSASDVMIQLAANDGEKFIGECPTIAILRTLEPTYDKQRITLREYATGSRKGGGQLRAVLSGSAYIDNGVTVFKTPGGAAWVRINADIINPLMAGALGTGLTTDDDTVAIQRIQTLSGVTVDFLGLTYYTTADLDFSGTTKSTFRNGTLKPSVAVSNVARVHNAGHVIDGLNIDGGFATAAIGYNVDASATAVIIKNCTIKNTGKSGIVNNAFEARIDNNWIDGCGLLAVPPFVNAIYMIANEGSIVSNSRLTRCYNGVYFRTDLAASKTSRNKLIDCFMRGNGQTSDAGAQGVSCQNNANLEISGCQIYDFPNNGIDLQFSDYCHVHDNYVAGCLDGIFIGDRSCKGHNIHNNTFYQCYRGFRFLCTSATYVGSFFDNQFIGNTIVNPTYRGMELNLPNAVSQSGNRICGNVVDMTGSSTSTAQVGIYCNTISVGELSNNIVRGSPQNGIALLNCSLLKVNENIIHDASRAVSGSYDSLYIESTCARVIVRDTMAYGTANYAVRVVSGATNCSITGTRYRSMTAGGVIDAGTGTVTSDNVAM